MEQLLKETSDNHKKSLKELEDAKNKIAAEKEIQEAIERAEMQMINNGIVAVGDICNTTDIDHHGAFLTMAKISFVERGHERRALAAGCKVHRSKIGYGSDRALRGDSRGISDLDAIRRVRIGAMS